MEYEHYLFKWESRSTNYGIYTTDSKIAKIIRRRKDTREFLDIIFPVGFKGLRFWLFKTGYHNYKSARKSFNRILSKHSYRELEYNATTGDWDSLSGADCTLKKRDEVANAK
jgi:hypothetical protein